MAAALNDYVDFGSLAPAPRSTRDRPAAVPERRHHAAAQGHDARRRGTRLRPAGRDSERKDGGLAVTTLVFVVADQRVSADFVEDVLVRYTISSK